MRHICLLLLFILISNYALCQNPVIDSTGKYHYTICIRRNSTIESKVLINEKMDSVTTDDSRIFGRVNLTDTDVLPYSFIEISSTTNSYREKFMTDKFGNYNIVLKPDKYNLSFKTSGHDTIKINDVVIALGDIRRISVLFGDLDGFYTFDYVTKKPLSEKKLKSVEQKLARDLEQRKSKQFAKPQL